MTWAERSCMGLPRPASPWPGQCSRAFLFAFGNVAILGIHLWAPT